MNNKNISLIKRLKKIFEIEKKYISFTSSEYSEFKITSDKFKDNNPFQKNGTPKKNGNKTLYILPKSQKEFYRINHNPLHKLKQWYQSTILGKKIVVISLISDEKYNTESNYEFGELGLLHIENEIELIEKLNEIYNQVDNKEYWLQRIKAQLETYKKWFSSILEDKNNSLYKLHSYRIKLRKIDAIEKWIIQQIEYKSIQGQPIETEPGNIDAHSSMQKILVLCKFGIIEYLETTYNLDKNQCFKLLGTITDINWGTIQRTYNAYKTGLLDSKKIDNRNNPDNETNRIWYINLLNVYKINIPQ